LIARIVSYQLAPLLALLMLAKLCGADKPFEIAGWVSASERKAETGSGLELETNATSQHLSADSRRWVKDRGVGEPGA